MNFTFLQMTLVLGLLVAAITDVRSGRIPNSVTFPLVISGLVFHTWADGWQGLLFSLLGCLVGLGCLIWFYARGGMGAGDVKLLGAIGAYLGPTQVVYAFAVAAILGGAYSLALLFAQGGGQHVQERMLLFLTNLRVARTASVSPQPVSQDPKLRYALVLGLGTLISQSLNFYAWW